jgi:hypothetical protein
VADEISNVMEAMVEQVIASIGAIVFFWMFGTLVYNSAMPDAVKADRWEARQKSLQRTGVAALIAVFAIIICMAMLHGA